MGEMKCQGPSKDPALFQDRADPPSHNLSMLLFTLDHLTDIVICLGHDAQVFYANHAAIERLGYDLNTLLTKSIHDIAPHFSASMWSEFWKMLATHTSFEMDSLLATAHGAELAVNMSFTYLSPEKDSYCCVVMRDIGARRQTEAAIQQLNQELTNVIGQQEQRIHDGQTRLRNLADNIPGMIYQMRLDLDPGGKSQSLTFMPVRGVWMSLVFFLKPYKPIAI